MEKSKIIVIEGTDGSGKATQTKILIEKLKALGKKVYNISFPKYESTSSSLVKMYLAGEIAENANDISAKAASIFYAADRYITYKKEMEEIYTSGEYIIVLDRYVGSNIIHQGSKCINSVEDSKKFEAVKEFVLWLQNLEYEDCGIPREDLTIYLNVPLEYTIKLREGRLNKFSNQEKQDIHESDDNHLRNASISGNMACEILNWKKIECVKDDNMRTIEEISDEIFSIVEKII